MSQSELSPYLQRLLELFDEKRKRFQWAFGLLLVGAIAFFFLVFFPYITLLGNRADCLAQQVTCTQLETSVLDERFTEVSTTWGNIPLSTAEVVVLFPFLIAVGTVAVLNQLVGLMRLRQGIQAQLADVETAIDVTLIAPLLIDPQRSLWEWIAGTLAMMTPIAIALFSINLIYGRLDELRNAVPYIQATIFYHNLYLLSLLTILFALARVGFAFFKATRYSK